MYNCYIIIDIKSPQTIKRFLLSALDQILFVIINYEICKVITSNYDLIIFIKKNIKTCVCQIQSASCQIHKIIFSLCPLTLEKNTSSISRVRFFLLRLNNKIIKILFKIENVIFWLLLTPDAENKLMIKVS